MNISNYIKSSIKGIKRDDNQDDLLVINTDSYQLYVVFDGVGSALNAKQAVEEAKLFVRSNHKKYLQLSSFLVAEMMFDANKYLLSLNVPEPYTTYCLLLISEKDNKVIISNLGDSRIYGITKQFLEILTKDDNIEANSNVITQCLGMNLNLADFRSYEIEKNYYRYLLCTDGFYNLMNKNKIEFFNTLNGLNFHKIKEKLDKKVKGFNFDDSTYIITEKNV